MTGYGAAFPRNSKHFMNFDRKVMDFSENGKNSLDIDLRFNTKTCFFFSLQLFLSWFTTLIGPKYHQI